MYNVREHHGEQEHTVCSSVRWLAATRTINVESITYANGREILLINRITGGRYTILHYYYCTAVSEDDKRFAFRLSIYGYAFLLLYIGMCPALEHGIHY